MPRKTSKFTIQCDGCSYRLWNKQGAQLLEVSSYEELFASPEWQGWKQTISQYDGETYLCPDCLTDNSKA